MKHSLSRFFGLGDKEHPERETEIEAEIAEHDTLKEEIQELPVDTIMPNR
ncbi:nucleoid occlusion protein, partial [Bacillus safensis]